MNGRYLYFLYLGSMTVAEERLIYYNKQNFLRKAMRKEYFKYNSLVINTNKPIPNPLHIRLLLKDITVFLIFLIVVPIVSFVEASTSFYDFIYEIHNGHIISVLVIIVVVLLIMILNIALMVRILSTKYVLHVQTTVASVITVFIFISGSIAGVYIRSMLEIATKSKSNISITPSNFYGLNQAMLNSRPDILTVVTMVAISLTVFSPIYSLAAARYSQVDYSNFQYWFKKLFNDLEKIKRYIQTSDLDKRDETITEYSISLNNAITELEKTLPVETRTYGDFINECLLSPLKQLQDFSKHSNVQMGKSLYSQLMRTDSQIAWIDEDGYRSAYQKLKYLIGGGAKNQK